MPKIKEIYAANYVGLWDARTGSMRDQSVGGNDGSFVGSPYFTNTRKGRSLTDFETTRYVNVNVGDNMKFTNEDWTMGIALYYNSTTNQGFGRGASNVLGPYFFQFNQPAPDKVSFYAANSTGTAWLVNTLNFFADLVPREFNEVVVTKTGATFRMYVNGVLGYTRVAASDTIRNDAAPFYIGRSSSGNGVLNGGKFINGWIIKDTPLSDTEVTQHWTETQQEAFLNHIPTKATDPSGTVYVHYYQTGEDWNVTPANVTSGVLSNTGWTINSGTWKISDNGKYKVLECVANGQLQRQLVGASGFTTTTFETVSGTPTLTKNTNDLQIDALAGEKVGIISLTP